MPADFDAVEAMYAAFPWLRELGLGDLLVSYVEQDTPPEAVASYVRQTAQYQERFSGMRMREANGFSPITEAEYLDLEDAYRSQLREYGLTSFLAPDSGTLRAFAARQIGNDISVSELNRRLDAGYAQVVDSGELVGQAFEQFYGVRPTDNELLLYALDPTRGIQEIENNLATTLVGSEALRYGLNINRTRAELLRQSGVNQQMARSGFADVARETPQLQTLAKIHNSSPFSQTDLEEFVFHDDPEVAKRRYQVFQSALNEFSGGAAPAASQSGTLLEMVARDRSV